MYYYKTYLKDRDSPSKENCPNFLFQAGLFSDASVLLAFSPDLVGEKSLRIPLIIYKIKKQP